MRTGLTLASGLLTLMACSAGEPTHQLVVMTKDGPPAALVSKIEKMLSGDLCLTKIAVMRREYRFATRNEMVIRNLVDVRVTEAGHDDLPAGIFILPPDRSYGFDRPYFVGFAKYGVREKDLDLWACGMNTGGSVRHKPRF